MFAWTYSLGEFLFYMRHVQLICTLLFQNDCFGFNYKDIWTEEGDVLLWGWGGRKKIEQFFFPNSLHLLKLFYN